MLRYLRTVGLFMTIVSLVATALLNVIPTPSASVGGWAVGSLVGTPTDVGLPDTCEVDARTDANDKVTCVDATWSIDGRAVSGTLYGRFVDLTHDDGTLVDRVDARAWGGAAYLRPSAGGYGFVAALAALIVLSVVTTAVSGLLIVMLNRRSRRWLTTASVDVQPTRHAEYDSFESLLGLVVLLAAAALVGAGVTALAAESTRDLVVAGGVCVAVILFTLFRGVKWLRQP